MLLRTFLLLLSSLFFLLVVILFIRPTTHTCILEPSSLTLASHDLKISTSTSTSTSTQNVDLRTTLQQQSSALDVMQKSEKTATSLMNDLATEKSLLSSDKIYLQTEIRNMEMKFDEKARENERNECAKFALESKVRSLHYRE